MTRPLPFGVLLTFTAALGWAPPGDKPAAPPGDAPAVSDPRLVIERFAAAPDIVHPVALDFDSRGRLLVVESHTHFRPPDYQGPKYDRVRVLEDTAGDGKADRFTTFFEGTRATMGLAAHPDGSVYLATRNEVLRLRDTDGDGKADVKERIVFLDTKGDYPHNGLSGLAFDSDGSLYFGLGENLGADYKLIGSDGATLRGGGEGGGFFHCSADGKGLRRVATGFWNPFGACRDVFGRIFVVDNDPDASPPCRMVHVVEGGDYGFQFRYGRAGRHPFQAWHGELPGTLPMMSGVGEAPCAVVSYESDGLPREYVGSLLVTSWADHRVERYAVTHRGASFAGERKPFVQGGGDFRPVGLAVAPDGSLFFSDWVRADYTLHGKGAVWHLRPREPRKPARPADPREALFSAQRPLREAAARRLAADDAGRDFLRRQLGFNDSRVRAASLTALLDAGDRKLDLPAVADHDLEEGIRALAVRALAARGADVRRHVGARERAAVRREAVAGLTAPGDVPRLLELLTDADPFLRSAVVHQLAGHPELLAKVDVGKESDPKRRAELLLAHRASGRSEGEQLVPAFLADADEGVRFLAAKWVSDEKLVRFRPQIVEALKDRTLNVRMYAAYATALARLDGREVSDAKLADYFAQRVADDNAPAPVRAMALRQVPAGHPRLTVALLARLMHKDDATLQLEAARALAESPRPERFAALAAGAGDTRLGDALRAQAVSGLAEKAQDLLDDLLRFARGDRPTLRDEALRDLIGVRLNDEQRRGLEELARGRPESADLVSRVLGKPFATGRPAANDVDAWLRRLEGPADADAGRRVFTHPKLAGCFRCHRVDGRGREVGPDLSTIGRTERRHVLESILQPSVLIAPHYQAWQLETADGKVRTGMLVGTELDVYTYLDAKGELFKVNTRDVVESRPVPASIMPEGLADQLTDQELRDLLAFLGSRR
jgi:putative membrane-bound dehydrogenase-like protein